MNKVCSVDECNNKHSAKGWCSKHYYRWKAHGNPNKLLYRFKYKTIKEALESGFIRGDYDECWEWKRGLNIHGYGCVQYHGVNYLSHRISWETYKGEIPKGINVLHVCDNRKCLNPNHLFLGTQADNVEDMISKNRHRASNGSKNGNSKLTEDKVKDIIFRLKNGETGNHIAKIYNVSISIISNIKNKHTWLHVKEKDDGQTNNESKKEIT